MVPLYIESYHSGLLEQRIKVAWHQLTSCELCPRKCKKNRLAGESGFCRTQDKAVVASYGPHFGEEEVLVGSNGSGTIFFGHCTLACVFCQNYDISQGLDNAEVGEEASSLQLAEVMLELQEQGCHNINFVTPSHVVPQILKALVPAIKRGLQIPLIYNSSGYERVGTLKLLEGIIDIYMPDFKFWKSETAARYLKAPDYPIQAIRAILEMQRQVGILNVNKKGVADRGLLLRHLLMPGCLEESRKILLFIGEQLSPATYINLMGHYHPCGRAHDFPELDRCIGTSEYEKVIEFAKQAGLTRIERPELYRLLAQLKNK